MGPQRHRPLRAGSPGTRAPPPSPEAAKATLLRRVSLDLTGLPPTPADLDAFLADTAPDAYERVVDRLLASPHYGERWARPWLDLARYADTNGYEKDNRRSIWTYRDWVIDALNRDMPFDQFTIEQIAGDLLPNATVDQKIATGFHRNTMINEEGGVDPEEFAVRSPRRSREHDRDRLARHDARLRPVPQPQVRSVHPERLLPDAGVLHQHRLREPFVRRRDALFRSRGSTWPRRSRRRRAHGCRRRSTGSKEMKAPTPALREARSSGRDDPGSRTTWTPLQPVQAAATNGVG